MKKFRVFRLARPVGEDLTGFARRALLSFDTVRDQPVFGWTSGEHLAARDFSPDTCRTDNYMRLHLVTACRKIPSNLLRAEIKVEEAVRLRYSGNDYLSRKERMKIRQELVDRMLPAMPVSLSGMAVVYRPDDLLVYVDAVSDRQAEVFAAYFRDATGVTPEPLCPWTLLIQQGRDPGAWPLFSFSRQVEADRTAHDAGCDFLTWLWYQAETLPDRVDAGAEGHIGVMLEGPLTLVMEGGGTHVTRLAKGNPVGSVEALACLQAGKKLRKAKLSFVKGERIWTFNFDAETFAVSGLRYGYPEVLFDARARFAYDMEQTETVARMIRALFTQFVKRIEAADAVLMRDWVDSRNFAI